MNAKSRELYEHNLKIARGEYDLGYDRWRHGGWYTNARYPSGACGCVSNNYTDKQWRIACDSRPDSERYAYPNREAAARAEALLIAESLLRKAVRV